MRAGLLDELLDGQPHLLAAPLETWLASRRFAAFVRDHLPKAEFVVEVTRLKGSPVEATRFEGSSGRRDHAGRSAD